MKICVPKSDDALSTKEAHLVTDVRTVTGMFAWVFSACLLITPLAVQHAFGAAAEAVGRASFNWETLSMNLVASVPASLIAAVGLVKVLRRQKVMHLEMNSHLTELLESNRARYTAEGIATGIAQEKAAQAERNAGAAGVIVTGKLS